MVIKRQRYLDKLISHMNNGLIKVITGIRRCGKSYLLFEIFYKYLLEQGVPKENIITVPLDDEEYAELIDAHKLSDYIKSRLVDSNQNYYVFIDEAQYAITKEEMICKPTQAKTHPSIVKSFRQYSGKLRSGPV